MDRPDISNLRKNRSIFMNLGFVISLCMVILAFNYTTTDLPVKDDFTIKEAIDEEVHVIRTAPERPKVVPPPSIEVSQKMEEQIQEFIEKPEPIPMEVETTVEVKKEIPEDLPVIAPVVVDAPPPAPIEIEPEVAETIFVVVEEMPRFPGCEEVGVTKQAKVQCSTNKLLKYLGNQINYPRIALENNIQGTVNISFVVDELGAITDIKVRREPGGGLGREAVRVVKTMPNWIPGKQRGKAVKVRFNLPVKFRLK